MLPTAKAADATLVAQATALADTAGTATAVRATAGALAAAASSNDIERALIDAQEAEVEATGAAVATAQAEAISVAIDPTYDEVSFQADLGGVLDGNAAAEEEARAELRRLLAPYGEGCRVGFVITFGHAPGDVGTGTALAAAVNALLEEEFPDLFTGAGFDNFWSDDPPAGQVDIRLYFFSGCVPAEPNATQAIEVTPGISIVPGQPPTPTAAARVGARRRRGG